MRQIVVVFGSSRIAPESPAWDEAYRFGRAVAEAGFDLASGGYGGAMEAASRGAKEAGALVVGVTAPAVFPQRAGANPYVDLEFPAPTLLSRIERMLDLGRAFLALPGGVGTFTEIAAAWNRAFVDRLAGRAAPPIFVHESWRALLFPALEITEDQLSLLTFVRNAEELKAHLAALE